jgi:uncharacterized protein YpmS
MRTIHLNLKQSLLLLPVLVLLSAVLACALPFQVPEPPGPPIPISTEAVESFKEKLSQVVKQARSGEPIELSLTEEEVTSAFAFYILDEQGTGFSDPQIYLRDGEVQVFGNYQSGDSSVPVRVVFEPLADEQGKPHIDLVSVNFGRFSAPDALVESIQTNLDNVWIDLMGITDERLWVDSLDAADGTLTIQGQIR